MSDSKEVTTVSTRNVSTAIIPKDLKEMSQIATLLATSDMLPTCYRGEVGSIIAAVQLGTELGVPPMTMLMNTYPVNGKIGFYTDLLVGMVKSQPDYGGCEVINDTDVCHEIKVKRMLKTGGFDIIHGKFTMADAERAGLTKNETYKKFPRRMLAHRNWGFVARDGWPDKLSGCYTVEELVSIDKSGSMEMRNVTNPNEASMDDLKQDEIIIAVDEVLEAIVKKAKEAKYCPKDLTEIRERYRAMKGSKQLPKLIKQIEEEIAAKVLRTASRVIKKD
jgi:hypothetical protein